MSMTLDHIDLLEDTWSQGVPHDMFEILRREAPVFWHPEPAGRGFWAVTKHADVRAISRDPGLYSSEVGGTFVDDQTEEQLAAMRLSILNMDAPKHNRYRRLVSRGFTPAVIQRITDSINRRAADVVASVKERGSCDFVADVAAVLPLEMICEMMGLPEADWYLRTSLMAHSTASAPEFWKKTVSAKLSAQSRPASFSPSGIW